MSLCVRDLVGCTAQSGGRLNFTLSAEQQLEHKRGIRSPSHEKSGRRETPGFAAGITNSLAACAGDGVRGCVKKACWDEIVGLRGTGFQLLVVPCKLAH